MPLDVTTAVSDRTDSSRSRAAFFDLLRKKLPGASDRMIFTEQLSLLLETGTPLHSSLAALQKQTGNPAMAGVIGGLTECIAEGKTFSAALSQYPEVFPSTYVHLVAAAENGGFLHKVLLELFTMDQRRENLRSTLSSALSYPIFLIFFSIAVVIFVLVVVFPKFADMFARIADELPATTRVLMSTSHFLVNHWLAVSVGTVLALACSYWWSRTGPGVWAIDRFKLEVWPLKDIFIRVYLTRTLRVLSLSLSNGVSVMDALVSCREVVSNHLFRSFVAQIEERVKEGSGFAFAFQQADFLPPTVKQMVATGEETGRLPHVLGRVADLYERELTRKLATFSRMIEPVMLLLMGGVIGLIVSALILPIFKLSRAVG